MRFEIYWKDYRRFGADGSTHLLGQWLDRSLRPSYGPSIETVLVCGYCRSLARPSGNLQSVHTRFEAELTALRAAPKITWRRTQRELDCRYATVWPTADEFQPDDLMLKVGTFRRSFLKLMTLLQIAAAQPKIPRDFDFDDLLQDIKALEPRLPRTLDDLVSLYHDVRIKNA